MGNMSKKGHKKIEKLLDDASGLGMSLDIACIDHCSCGGPWVCRPTPDGLIKTCQKCGAELVFTGPAVKSSKRSIWDKLR